MTQVQTITDSDARGLALAQAASNQDVIASDVPIPRLLLMQGISTLVSSRKAQIGELRRSTTGELLGSPEKPLDIIPLRMTNSWTNYEIVRGKAEFRGQEPRDSSTENLPWEYKGEKNSDWKRQKTITLYALLPGDVLAYTEEMKRVMAEGGVPDLTRTVMPIVITFQSTSFKTAGKKCAELFAQVRTWSATTAVAPYDYVLALSCVEESNDKGTYYVFDLGRARALVNPKEKDAAVLAAQKAIKETAASWSQRLLQGQVKVHDDGAEEVLENVSSREAARREAAV